MESTNTTNELLPAFFLDLPPELTSLILLSAGPEATAVLKSVNSAHAALVRNLEEDDLSKHWYYDVQRSYLAPSYARKLKIEVSDATRLLYNTYKRFVSPTDCTSSTTRSGTHRITATTTNVESKISELYFEWTANCERSLPMNVISSLPPGLTVLRLYFQLFPTINAQQLPETLRILDIQCNELFHAIKEKALPESLLELHVSKCRNFRQLPSQLPPYIQVLDCSGTRLDQTHVAGLELPSTLRVLNVSGISGLDQDAVLPRLPDGLCELKIERWETITRFPYADGQILPSQLRVLNMAGCRGLEQWPNLLPPQLQTLKCSGCRRLKLSAIPALPSTLRVLDVCYVCNDLHDDAAQLLLLFDRFPSALETLSLVDMRLRTLPANFLKKFSQLRFLCLSLNELQQLPSSMPHTLEYLDVSNNQLTHLPRTLPSRLKRLYVGNNQLTKLPQILPSELRELYVKDNHLTELPPLPQSLKKVSFGNNEILNYYGQRNELRALGIVVDE